MPFFQIDNEFLECCRELRRLRNNPTEKWSKHVKRHFTQKEMFMTK